MRVRLLRQGGGLGDVIRCFSVARSIKIACPDAEVWFYTLKRYAEEASWCPHIDRVVALAGSVPCVRHKIVDPDQFPFLHSAVKFDATVNLLGLAQPYVRSVAPHVELGQIEMFTTAAEEATGLSLAPAVPVLSVGKEAVDAAEAWLAKNEVARDRPLVALQPHSTTVLRCFSPEQFEKLVTGLVKHVSLVVLGVLPSLKEAIGMGAAVGVRVPRLVLLGLLHLCRLLVGVDSGLFHLATAVSTPTVVVLGSTGGDDLGRLYPLASWIEAGSEERTGLGCQGPCYRHSYHKQLAVCNKSYCQAMIRIPTDRILASVMERLEQCGT